MKIPLHLFFAAVILNSSLALAANHMVTMKSLSFDPVKIEIKAGDTIEWTNISYTEHSALSEENPPLFDTGRVKPKNHSAKILLTKPGTFKYRCSVHGKTMSGEVVVVP